MTSVMVVDDTPDIRLLFDMNLRSLGYGVFHATGGEEAKRMLAGGTHPDLVVLDVQMADVDGWDVLTALRADPATAELPVILCTVKSRAQDEAHGWRLGCDGYVSKPFDIGAFEREITDVLARDAQERRGIRASRLAEAEARMLPAGSGA